MGKLPWSERVNMLSIHPHAATIEDIAKLAADASEITALRARVAQLEAAVEWALDYLEVDNFRPMAADELRRRARKEG